MPTSGCSLDSHEAKIHLDLLSPVGKHVFRYLAQWRFTHDFVPQVRNVPTLTPLVLFPPLSVLKTHYFLPPLFSSSTLPQPYDSLFPTPFPLLIVPLYGLGTSGAQNGSWS